MFMTLGLIIDEEKLHEQFSPNAWEMQRKQLKFDIPIVERREYHKVKYTYKNWELKLNYLPAEPAST